MYAALHMVIDGDFLMMTTITTITTAATKFYYSEKKCSKFLPVNENTICWKKKEKIKTKSEMCCEYDEGQNDGVFTFETFWMNPVY